MTEISILANIIFGQNSYFSQNLPIFIINFLNSGPQCAVACGSDVDCLLDCFDKRDEALKNCPCRENCPNDCPCPSFNCDLMEPPVADACKDAENNPD